MIEITMKELEAKCPSCANKVRKVLSVRATKLLITESDYYWLNLKKDDRPPKEWFDRCVESVGAKAEDPNALCGYIYQQGGESDECPMPSDEQIKTAKEQMAELASLKEDMTKVMGWREAGLTLTSEQRDFAHSVVDRMIKMKSGRSVGIVLLSPKEIAKLNKYEPSGIVQDAVETPQTKKKKDPRHIGDDIDEVNKGIKGERVKEVPISESKGPEHLRYTPDISNIKANPPEGQDEGQVSSTADEKSGAKDSTGQPSKDIPSEQISHHPNDPLPKKMAEELIRNVRWGIDVGAYKNEAEGIEAQLSRKQYVEFVDTDSKKAAVLACLKACSADMKEVKI